MNINQVCKPTETVYLQGGLGFKATELTNTSRLRSHKFVGRPLNRGNPKRATTTSAEGVARQHR